MYQENEKKEKMEGQREPQARSQTLSSSHSLSHTPSHIRTPGFVTVTDFLGKRSHHSLGTSRRPAHHSNTLTTPIIVQPQTPGELNRKPAAINKPSQSAGKVQALEGMFIGPLIISFCLTSDLKL